MKKNENVILLFVKALLALVLAIVLLAFILAIDGYIFSKMWEWFLMPIFDAKLSVIQSCGIVVLFRFLVLSTINLKEEETDKTALIVKGLIIRGFALLLGYYLHLSMLQNF